MLAANTASSRRGGGGGGVFKSWSGGLTGMGGGSISTAGAAGGVCATGATGLEI